MIYLRPRRRPLQTLLVYACSALALFGLCTLWLRDARAIPSYPVSVTCRSPLAFDYKRFSRSATKNPRSAPLSPSSSSSSPSPPPSSAEAEAAESSFSADDPQRIDGGDDRKDAIDVNDTTTVADDDDDDDWWWAHPPFPPAWPLDTGGNADLADRDSAYDDLGSLDLRTYRDQLAQFLREHLPAADSDETDPTSLLNVMNQFLEPDWTPASILKPSAAAAMAAAAEEEEEEEEVTSMMGDGYEEEMRMIKTIRKMKKQEDEEGKLLDNNDSAFPVPGTRWGVAGRPPMPPFSNRIFQTGKLPLPEQIELLPREIRSWHALAPPEWRCAAAIDGLLDGSDSDSDYSSSSYGEDGDADESRSSVKRAREDVEREKLELLSRALGWSYEYFDDDRAMKWVESRFAKENHSVDSASLSNASRGAVLDTFKWFATDRPVMAADLWRYLVLASEGSILHFLSLLLWGGC
jgi:hypothetical protein